MFRRGFDAEPVRGKVVHDDDVALVLRKKAAFSIAGNFGRVLGIVFIQGIVLRIGIIGHRFLLSVKQGAEGMGARHSVKYPDGLLINNIIQNFQQLCIGVKAQYQVFFVVIVHNIVIFRMV
jgi:hypothetical protein